jgi:hypothetical protein
LANLTPLRFYQPGTYHCPAILARIDAFIFDPLSDSATIIGSDTGSGFGQQLKSTITSKGFWTTDQADSFSNFKPGTYTVVGADEWGALVIIHFDVLQWSTPPTSSPVSSGNLQITVTGLSDVTLPGAKVVSQEQPDGQLKVTGLTDSDGTVTFNGIKPGKYSFYIGRYDYIQTDFTVTLNGGQTTRTTINLEPSPTPR